MPVRKIIVTSAASTASPIPRVAIPAYANGSARQLRPWLAAEPTARPRLDGIVEPTEAVAEALHDLTCKRRRLVRERRTQLGTRQNLIEKASKCGASYDPVSNVERQSAVQRISQQSLQRRARQHLFHEPLRPRALHLRPDLSVRVSACESLGRHPPDDLILDKRARDRFRELPREHTLDDVFCLRRREHVSGHGLDATASVDLGAST